MAKKSKSYWTRCSVAMKKRTNLKFILLFYFAILLISTLMDEFACLCNNFLTNSSGISKSKDL